MLDLKAWLTQGKKSIKQLKQVKIKENNFESKEQIIRLNKYVSLKCSIGDWLRLTKDWI